MGFQVNKKWLDRYGNIKPNSWDEQSENPSTFNAAYLFLQSVLNVDAMGHIDVTEGIRRIRGKWETNNDEYRTMEYDPNPDFSLDEKISVAALCRFMNDEMYIKIEESLEHLELFTTDISHYRPDVFCYVLACKFPILLPLCWIFIALPAMYTCLFGDDSSGPQLVFIKCQGLGLHRLFSICTTLLAWNKHYESWDEIFETYYPEEDHPSRVLAKRIWG